MYIFHLIDMVGNKVKGVFKILHVFNISIAQVPL